MHQVKLRPAEISSAADRIRQRAKDQAQRRAKLMAYVREKQGFGPIDGRQRFGTFALLLVRPGSVDGAGNLSGDEFEKAPILFVEAEPRTYTGHEKSRDLIDGARSDRDYHGDMRRIAPRSCRNLREPLRKIFDCDRRPA